MKMFSDGIRRNKTRNIFLSLHANEDKLSKIQAKNMSSNLSTKTPATQLTYNGNIFRILLI